MITKRIIPCLDVRDGRVVKGVNFQGLADVSSPVELAKYYSENGADETEQSRFCRERGVYADEIAARVNDAAVDTDAIGDIVLEASAAGGYSIVEDYRSDLE